MLISMREHHTSNVFNLGPGPINITVTCKQEANSGRTCMDFYCDLESFLTTNQYVQAQLVVTAGDRNITSCHEETTTVVVTTRSGKTDAVELTTDSAIIESTKSYATPTQSTTSESTTSEPPTTGLSSKLTATESTEKTTKSRTESTSAVVVTTITPLIFTETLNFDLGIEISEINLSVEDAERLPDLDFSQSSDPVVIMITEYVNSLLEDLLEDYPHLILSQISIIGIEHAEIDAQHEGSISRKRRDTMQISFHGFILQIQIVVENKVEEETDDVDDESDTEAETHSGSSEDGINSSTESSLTISEINYDDITNDVLLEIINNKLEQIVENSIDQINEEHEIGVVEIDNYAVEVVTEVPVVETTVAVIDETTVETMVETAAETIDKTTIKTIETTVETKDETTENFDSTHFFVSTVYNFETSAEMELTTRPNITPIIQTEDAFTTQRELTRESRDTGNPETGGNDFTETGSSGVTGSGFSSGDGDEITTVMACHVKKSL